MSGLDTDPAGPAATPERRAVRIGGAGRVFFAVGTAALLMTIAWLARSVLIPVVIAGFVCFLIYTLKQVIKEGPLYGRFLPDWLAYLLAFSLIVSITIFFLEMVLNNVETLIAAWPDYEARLRNLTLESIGFLSGLGVLPEEFIGGVEELRSAAFGVINPVLREVGAMTRTLAANSVTILLYTVFMLLERGRIFRKIALISGDPDRRSAVNETLSEIAAMVRQYITVKTLMNLVTATATYVILSLVGVDFARFWAMIMFILTYIPIVGAILAISLPVLLALVQPDGGGVRMAGLTLILLVANEQLMSSVIEPRLIGRSLNLSPLNVLLSLAVWGSIWGFAGALLAVPMTVTVMIILAQFRSTRPIAILLSDSGEIAPLREGRLRPARAAPETKTKNGA